MNHWGQSFNPAVTKRFLQRPLLDLNLFLAQLIHSSQINMINTYKHTVVINFFIKHLFSSKHSGKTRGLAHSTEPTLFLKKNALVDWKWIILEREPAAWSNYVQVGTLHNILDSILHVGDICKWWRTSAQSHYSLLIPQRMKMFLVCFFFFFAIHSESGFSSVHRWCAALQPSLVRTKFQFHPGE